jgi:hypothetical protein
MKYSERTDRSEGSYARNTYSGKFRRRILVAPDFLTGRVPKVYKREMDVLRESRVRLQARLVRQQLSGGGWSFSSLASQADLEPTCFALLALRNDGSTATAAGLEFLLRIQNPNGSWPAFEGDDNDGCWVTALAVTTLINCVQPTAAVQRGLKWLSNSKGRESRWPWKWKFRTTDTRVRLNPDKFGWPWMPDTCSWVVPTAFSVLALRQGVVCCRSPEAHFRVIRGIEMLIDRVCLNGGWNAGNGVVYSVALGAHVDATAIALLPLRGEPQRSAITRSLDWLESRVRTCFAPWSLAWSILALDAHGRFTEKLLVRLAALSDPDRIEDSATLAALILALDCPIQGNVFRIPL